MDGQSAMQTTLTGMGMMILSSGLIMLILVLVNPMLFLAVSLGLKDGPVKIQI